MELSSTGPHRAHPHGRADDPRLLLVRNFLAQWNRALRAIAEAHVPDIGDRARLFALANLAMADAFINAWESKLHFNFWRPVTAIQEGEFDGNPKTGGDPDWQPLVNTPPYPDYTSGANNVTGVMTRILALFFGTDVFDFTITSNSPNLTDPATRTRNYTRFSEAAEEVVEAASSRASISAQPMKTPDSRVNASPIGPSRTSCSRSTLLSVEGVLDDRRPAANTSAERCGKVRPRFRVSHCPRPVVTSDEQRLHRKPMGAAVHPSSNFLSRRGEVPNEIIRRMTGPAADGPVRNQERGSPCQDNERSTLCSLVRV